MSITLAQYKTRLEDCDKLLVALKERLKTLFGRHDRIRVISAIAHEENARDILRLKIRELTPRPTMPKRKAKKKIKAKPKAKPKKKAKAKPKRKKKK